MEFLIKGLYLLIGLVAGYLYSKNNQSLTADSTEKQLYKELVGGKRIMIAIDDVAVVYKLQDGVISMKRGIIDVEVLTSDDNLDSNGIT